LVQALVLLAAQRPALYVSGEESAEQISLRAQRLGLDVDRLRLLTETCVERILALVAKERPGVLVLDSIQTFYTEALQSAPGSVAQVRESAARLVRFAKQTGTALFLVGHVTKEGALAGPRVLEHMVDTVLYFEGESGSPFRLIRAIKNRFGAVNELGVFAMTDKGLREVNNPSAIFLSRHEREVPGSCILVTREGTRPLLVEVQALVDQSPLANPRRVALGLEQNRLSMLLAVLHRHGGIGLFDQDVFLNVVGGVRVTEPAADLPVLLSVLSSFRDRPLPGDLATFGEVGLAGEIRPVPNGQERLREAAKHGFSRVILPKANAPKSAPDGVEVIAVSRIGEAIDALT
jgi:DNA repair protein RadA/Sms